jgi:hypothetical protein
VLRRQEAILDGDCPAQQTGGFLETAQLAQTNCVAVEVEGEAGRISRSVTEWCRCSRSQGWDSSRPSGTDSGNVP